MLKDQLVRRFPPKQLNYLWSVNVKDFRVATQGECERWKEKDDDDDDDDIQIRIERDTAL